jgi:hypothetical protein
MALERAAHCIEPCSNALLVTGGVVISYGAIVGEK